MLAFDLERLSAQSVNSAKSLRVRSALNPLLWLNCITVPTLLAGAWMFASHPWLCELLAISAVVMIFLAVAAFWYLALKKPEQLRSEDFQLRYQALQIYREKTGVVRALPMSVEKILIPPRKHNDD